MENHKIRTLLLGFTALLIFTGISCSKTDQTVIENTWQVESIVADNILLFPVDEKITLGFKNKRKYTLNLGVNSCSGDVSFKSKNSVSFETAPCTKACCDTEFALKAQKILLASDEYSATDLKLTFIADEGNKVNFIKQK